MDTATSTHPTSGLGLRYPLFAFALPLKLVKCDLTSSCYRHKSGTNSTGRSRYEQDLVLSPTSPRSPDTSQDLIQLPGTVEHTFHSQQQSTVKIFVELLQVTSQLLPITAIPCLLDPTELAFKLPNHLMRQLEKWHQQNPSTRPVIVSPPMRYRPSKVFDRKGRELRIQAFKIITESMTYYLQVLCPAEERKKFVFAGTSNHRFGTWLRAWLGPDKGTETDFCAVRLFGNIPDDPTLSHYLWDNAPTKPPVMNPPTKRAEDSPNAPETVSPPGSGQESEEEIQTRPRRKSNRLQKGPLVLNYCRSSRLRAVPEDSALNTPASAPGSPSAATTSGGQAANTDSEESVVDHSGVKFRFINPRGVETRVTTIRGTGRGEELFTKGKVFFQLLNPSVKVDCLVCIIPSMNEVRHVFDGAWDEIDSLILDIEELQKTTGKQEVIEVRYARI